MCVRLLLPGLRAPLQRGPPLLLLSVAVFSSSVDGACQGPNTQGDLFSNITADYNRRDRPHSEGGAVDVEVQLYLTSLTEINQKQERLGLAGYFRVWWTDSRLEFKSKSEGGCLNDLYLTDAERVKIWQPDLYFDNVLTQSHGADLVLLNSSGSVWKSQRVNHVFECKMDFTRIPFDTQVCKIIVGSYSEDSSKVRVHPREGDRGITLSEDHAKTTVWDISRVHSYVKRPLLSGRPWTYVVLEVTLTRLPDYYVRGIVLKAVLFVVISWCSFFVNRTVAPARVAISVIPVLIMLNLLQAVDAVLPPISYNTFLTNFLITCLCFAACSVFEYAVVAYLLQIENWYAEKSAVLMHLSKTDLMKSTNQAPVSHWKTSAADVEKGDERASAHSGHPGEISPAPSKLFRDHPVITEIYKEFDTHHNGRFSAKMMRNTLRRFGQYRSLREVREIFEKLGVVEGEDMTLSHFEQFLANPSTYIPVAPTRRSFWDMPPSLQLDIYFRFIYPAAFVLFSLIMLTTLV